MHCDMKALKGPWQLMTERPMAIDGQLGMSMSCTTLLAIA